MLPFEGGLWKKNYVDLPAGELVSLQNPDHLTPSFAKFGASSTFIPKYTNEMWVFLSAMKIHLKKLHPRRQAYVHITPNGEYPSRTRTSIKAHQVFWMCFFLVPRHRYTPEIPEPAPSSFQHGAQIGGSSFFPVIKITVFVRCVCHLHLLRSEHEDKHA